MVKAGVGGGEAVGGGPVAADDKGRLQGSQPLDGNAVAARNKKQQPLLLLLVKCVHHLPEPLYDLALQTIAPVILHKSIRQHIGSYQTNPRFIRFV